MRVCGAYLVLPPTPFRGRSPPASPTSTPVFDCVIYSQRDGTRSYRTEAAAEKMDLFSWTHQYIGPLKRLCSSNLRVQDAPHPCVQLLQELWGDLGAVFARHGGDTRCMERLCRCYKHTARNCGTAFHAVVPALLPQVTSWYEERPQSCFLYVCNVCLTQYGGSVSALAPTFAESFGRMATATFRVLSASPSALLDSPDIVDDFFELCSKVLRRMPALLLESEALTTLFHCGCAGLHVQHREANRSVVSFFETLVPLCKGGEHSRVLLMGCNGMMGQFVVET